MNSTYLTIQDFQHSTEKDESECNKAEIREKTKNKKQLKRKKQGINSKIQKYISIQWNRKRNQCGCYLLLLFKSKNAINDLQILDKLNKGL